MHVAHQITRSAALYEVGEIVIYDVADKTEETVEHKGQVKSEKILFCENQDLEQAIRAEQEK
jgi:predicted SPOUT superfamily RNA methylase MTH1